MSFLRSTLVVVTLFLFFSFQIKANIDIDSIISLLELGEANATATFNYLDGGQPINTTSENRAICSKWYSQVPQFLSFSINYLKEKNIPKAIDDVNTADDYTKNCQDVQIEDATLSSSNDYIIDICYKVHNELQNPPLII
ncbi:hypothetical protein MTR67_044576 [Solanum verrucosum]|uniref:Uncharacterized protein n=1 Tax=Solanum verrucosum TaxID=315347 RepID=A0AAF0UU74_SOLVR|nr:hypothetical protein MTR67_044576 [Solanum verrucosum]